jgi:hypothetical protein
MHVSHPDHLLPMPLLTCMYPIQIICSPVFDVRCEHLERISLMTLYAILYASTFMSLNIPKLAQSVLVIVMVIGIIVVGAYLFYSMVYGLKFKFQVVVVNTLRKWTDNRRAHKMDALELEDMLVKKKGYLGWVLVKAALLLGVISNRSSKVRRRLDCCCCKSTSIFDGVPRENVRRRSCFASRGAVVQSFDGI